MQEVKRDQQGSGRQEELDGMLKEAWHSLESRK